MEIQVITIGRLKNRYFQAIEHEYLARVNRYIKCQIIESPDLKKGHHRSIPEIVKAEAEIFLAQIPADYLLIVLDAAGKRVDSLAFAKTFQRQLCSGKKGMAFLIGGPYGISPKVKQQAALLLSLSDLTFTHEFCRLVLIEQIYRAYTIIRGEPYHH